jgi:hypothetical protein
MRLKHLVTLASLCLAAPLGAQEHPAVERGLSPDKTLQLSNVDSVNLLNGAASVALAIGPRFHVGGGLTYGLTAVASSKTWDFEEIVGPSPGPTYLVRSMPAQHANAGLSFTVTLGKLIPPFDPSNETGRWQYLDSSGGRVSFFSKMHPTDAVTAGFSYTREDSRPLRMHVIAGGKRTVEFPGGEIHTFSAAGLLESMSDRHGNEVTISYPDALTWEISDSHRTHTVHFKNVTSDGQTIQVVDSVDLEAFGGERAVYTFTHTSTLIPKACTDTFRSAGAQIEVQLLTEIGLPDDSKYEMEYYESGCSGGVIRSVTLPTLGRLEYGYGIWELPVDGCAVAERTTWANRTQGVTSRTFYDLGGNELGTWQYQQSLMGPPETPTGFCTGTDEDPSEVSRTVVVSPEGHSYEHFFSVWPNLLPIGGSPNGFQVAEYGLPFDRTQADETGTRFLSTRVSEGGVAKRSVYVRYEYENPCDGDNTAQICSESNRRLVSQRTVYHDDKDGAGNDRVADVTYSDHTGLGQYRTVRTDGTFPSGNVRTSFVNYHPGHDLVLGPGLLPQSGYVMWPTNKPWVLGTYSETTTTESGNTIKVLYCFDSDTGFLLRTRRMLDTSPSRDDVVARFTPDADGNVRFEEYFGGDLQTLTLQENLCGMQLPETPEYHISNIYSAGSLATSRYLKEDGISSVGFLLVDRTIDPSTGLVAASRNSSGIETTLEYDTMGRLLWEKPAAGHGAYVQYLHDRATSATSRRPG